MSPTSEQHAQSSSDDSPDIKPKEDDPTSVDFYFLKTGKSKGEGVLITHGDTFKFTKNNMNRKETIHYYTCAQKLTYKCTARAIITCEVDVDEDGKDVVKIRLVEVATPEVGGRVGEEERGGGGGGVLGFVHLPTPNNDFFII